MRNTSLGVEIGNDLTSLYNSLPPNPDDTNLIDYDVESIYFKHILLAR